MHAATMVTTRRLHAGCTLRGDGALGSNP